MLIPSRLLDALFPLLIVTSSKSLRELLFKKIISDLRSSNAKSTNHKLNRSMQSTLYNIIASDPSSSQGLWAVKITREMWKRQIWTDAKAVDIMKEAALSDSEKVIAGGVRFFLGGDKEREEHQDESEDDADEVDITSIRHQMGINKKTKKRGKDLRKAAATVRKKEKKKGAPHPLNFSALHLLHDPQGFAESLFSKHLQSGKSRLSLENRLLVLQLVTRLVGLHKLTLISLYSYFLKYLSPRQQSVTTFMACLGQATHDLVPPDLISPLVHKIANEFVSEGSASEVASAGLNTIREVCSRQPLAMDETLLQDLVMYRKSKDKGVMMAAKGLLSLYRDVGAEMLKKRDRGKDAAMNLRQGEGRLPKFGEVIVDDGIAGIELLEQWKDEERRRKRSDLGEASDEELDEEKLIEQEEAEGWKDWDVESNASDDSGGWIEVASDGDDDIQVSDSDDERPKQKKQKVEEAVKKDETNESKTPDPSDLSAQSRSTFATTRILTPADLAKLRELQAQSAILANMPNRKGNAPNNTQRATTVQQQANRHADDPLTAAEIEGLAALSHKTTKEEKLAKSKGDKDEKHASTTAIRKEKKRAAGKSTTNKEKARQKNFLMTLGKAKSKGRRSLTDVKKAMRGHIERSKRGGRRGNIG
jgi:protein SDA1